MTILKTSKAEATEDSFGNIIHVRWYEWDMADQTHLKIAADLREIDEQYVLGKFVCGNGHCSANVTRRI